MLIQGITFRGEVEVDGNTYEKCTFEKCTIVYRGGERPVYAHCSFDGVSFRFADAADNTIGFLTDLFHNGFKKTVEQTFKNIRTAKPFRYGEVGH